MNPHVAMILHLEPPPALGDDALGGWWAEVGEPLMDTLAQTRLPVGLVLSGPLLGWLADVRPPALEALRTMVLSQQIELVTVPFHGPVASAVPLDDVTDQVFAHLTLVRRLFEVRPQGAWLPKQVWDPAMPRVLGRAEIAWTMVHDSAIAQHHVDPAIDPWGAWRTEREGHALTLLANDAGAQALRGIASPDEVFVYLRGRYSQGARDVIMSWDVVRRGAKPVAEVRWLGGMLRAIAIPKSDISMDRPSDVAARVRGRVYLPSWAPESVGVPWERRLLLSPAADRLHKRMLRVSRLLTRLTKRVRRQDPDAPDPDRLLQARRYLHRAQGAAHYEPEGIEDARLRHRGWRDLLRAEEVAERAAGTWRRLVAEMVDLTTGGREQVLLRTPSWVVVVDPDAGGGCTELGFVSGAMNLVDPCAREGLELAGAFVEHFPLPEDDIPTLQAQGQKSLPSFEAHSVERGGDASVRATLSRALEVGADDPRTLWVHKAFSVRVDGRIDVVVELQNPTDAPIRARFAIQVPLTVGVPIDDVVVSIDGRMTPCVKPVDATEVRAVTVEGDAVRVTLSMRERARVWVFPETLGVTAWVEWPIEVFSRESARFKLRLVAEVIERLEDASDGVPLQVLEDGKNVGDTVVLQRNTEPPPADRVPAHAAVKPAGVDLVSRRLSLVPPRAPVPPPQRPALYVPPDPSDDADVTEAAAPDATDAPPLSRVGSDADVAIRPGVVLIVSDSEAVVAPMPEEDQAPPGTIEEPTAEAARPEDAADGPTDVEPSNPDDALLDAPLAEAPHAPRLDAPEDDADSWDPTVDDPSDGQP